jgi:drug/metabolite transporter (DMT)-like permease
MRTRRPGVFEALAAACLFGAATPLASRLVGSTSPQVLAGLLYLGSGLVLWVSMWRWPSRREAPLTRRELPALSGAIFFGGGLAPVLLVIGLRTTPAASASLLLNLEVVFTALIAWLAFHEGFSPRVGIGLALILGGGVLVSWQPHHVGFSWGALAIAGACACWALDNNLTQRVSAKDPRQIATLKGVIAGSTNLAIGLLVGAALPNTRALAGAIAIGVFGYGISLMLFVSALRALGAARTGAFFAIAPFAGVVVAIGILGDPIPALLLPAGALMGLGAWLYISEHHEHRHTHEPLIHNHVHSHDDSHHNHEHLPGTDTTVPHSHEHAHPVLVHEHEHRPDIHHRHRHRRSRPAHRA